MTATVTAEFRDEFEADRTRLLKRRILWYVGVLVLFGIFAQIVSTIVQKIGPQQNQTTAMLEYQRVLSWFAWGSYLVYAGVFFAVWRRALSRAQMLRLIFWVIVIVTGIAHG